MKEADFENIGYFCEVTNHAVNQFQEPQGGCERRGGGVQRGLLSLA